MAKKADTKAGIYNEAEAIPQFSPPQPLAAIVEQPLQPEPQYVVRQLNWLDIIDKMVEKGSSAEILTKAFEIQRAREIEEQRQLFVKAFAEFKREAPASIERTKHVGYDLKTGGRTEYDHVELDHANDLLVPLLSKHGLTTSWETVQDDKGVGVTCRLEHVGGFSRVVFLRATPDTSGSKNSIQAVGSAVYYLERYTLLAVLGIAQKKADDDGAGSTDVITADQVKELHNLLNEALKLGSALAAPEAYDRWCQFYGTAGWEDGSSREEPLKKILAAQFAKCRKDLLERIEKGKERQGVKS